jgi:hypothetical protein
VLKFGLCVITVSLFSGCASTSTVPGGRPTMRYQDLNYFQVDCRRKQEQVEMLQSMRQSQDDMRSNALTNLMQPWTAVTNPRGFYERQKSSEGGINKQVNYNLFLLSYCQ